MAGLGDWIVEEVGLALGAVVIWGAAATLQGRNRPSISNLKQGLIHPCLLPYKAAATVLTPSWVLGFWDLVSKAGKYIA